MLTVGVFLKSGPEAGGGFQYELTIAHLLQRHAGKDYRFYFLVNDATYSAYLNSLGLRADIYADSLLQKVHRGLCRNVRVYGLLKRFRLHLNNIDRELKRLGVDLVYFLSPSSKCADLSNHSYILTVWDLCHRDFMEFPEVSAQREFFYREAFYSRYAPAAVAVTVDSEVGKTNIVRRYGVDSERVHVLPFLPGTSVESTDAGIDIRGKYDIRSDFIFYPAQFWAHKNHIYILDALRLLKERHSVRIEAVFSGTDKGNLGYVMQKSVDYGLQDQVKYVGFVSVAEVASLYKEALALVMPTYFGPTNIPPLEAFALGCPVCYSDLDGMREQVGGAAFLIDLENPQTLVTHLLTIQRHPEVVAEMKTRGREVLSSWTEEDFWNGLQKIFDSFAAKRRCWA